MDKRDPIGLDFDSTLSCTTQRQHMIRRDGTFMDWDAYGLACFDDTPGPALPLAQFLTEIEYPFIIISGRSEKAREASEKWLANHNVKPWHMFLADTNYNGLSHAKWKAQRVLEVQELLSCKIKFFVEDWSEVAIELEKIGIPTILVHEPNKLAEFLG